MPNTIGISNNRGPLRASGRTLTDNSGRAILLVGDAAWSGIIQLTNAQMNTYLTDRAARGFNCVLVELIEHEFGANSPSNIDNVSPWTGATWATPNEAYFVRADYFVKRALQLGIYVMMSPLYLGIGLGSEGWGAEVAAASTGTMTTWGAYVGGRYKNYNNIVWCIGGDADPTDVLTKVNAFVTGLTGADANHLLTFHDQRPSLASDNLAGASWLTLQNFYTDHTGTPQGAIDAYASTPTRPMFQIEAWYENEHSMTAQGLRAQAYWSILGGGVGHIFGNNPIWKFAYDGVTSDWTNALDDAGSVGMTYFGQLFNAFAWSTLVPDSAHSFVTAGNGTLGNADYAGVGKNSTGTLAMIYMPSNRTMTIVMSQMAGSTTCRWYDPTNGTYTADAASPVAASGTHGFSRAGANSAGANDWVLVLEA